MKRIAPPVLAVMLMTSTFTLAQEGGPALPGATAPVAGQYSHASYYFRQTVGSCNSAPTCPTCDAPAKARTKLFNRDHGSCESCGRSKSFNLRGDSCEACGHSLAAGSTCNSCGKAPRRSGNLLRRLADWVCYRPTPSDCDWQTCPQPYQPDGWKYFKCYQGPGISCDCGPRERRDWGIHFRKKCPTCGGCEAGNCGAVPGFASSCGPNGCAVSGAPAMAPSFSPYPPQPAAPLPHVAPQLPATLPYPATITPISQPTPQQQPHKTNYRQPAPGTHKNDPALVNQPNLAPPTVPGYKPLNLNAASYKPMVYPPPVPANYSLPPVSMPLNRGYSGYR